MSKETLLKYGNFSQANKKKCFALRKWCDLQGNRFSLQEVFDCIYDAANGEMNKITSLIEQLTAKDKTFGRSSVVFGSDEPHMTIIRDENGKPQIKNYDENFTPSAKGQHLTHSQNVIRKDGQMKRNVINSREKLYDLGQEVRSIYDGQSNEFITYAMKAIKEFAKSHKIAEMLVVDRLKKDVYRLDTTNGIKNAIILPKMKTIKLNEGQINELSGATKLTEYKFYNNVQRFLSDLLRDPVGAKVPFLLQVNNIARNNLLYHLKKQGIINRFQKISDRDSQGNPKTARMVIRYSVPKKDFAKKMKKLFIAMVAKNVPEKIEKYLNEDYSADTHSKFDKDLEITKNRPLTIGVDENIEECDCGGAMGATAGNDSMGQFSQPLFGVQRRKMPTEIDETTTASNVTQNGDISMGISVPFGSDKETKDRTPGFSVERQDEYLDRKMSKVKRDFKNRNYDESHGFTWSEDAKDGKEIVHNEWIVHFSNDSHKIAQEGFKLGNDYNNKLKSVTYRQIKTEGGYNYGYLATDVLKELNGRFMSYLEDRLTPFVMFKGNGYRFYHSQDDENQVVFNNVQKGTMVYVMFAYEQWCVLSTNNPNWKNKDQNPKPENEEVAFSNPRNILNGIIYSSENIKDVIKWIMNNFEQYRNKFKY